MTRATRQRDARDRRWSNLLVEIGEEFAEHDWIDSAIECWRLADSVAHGFTFEDILRRIYDEAFLHDALIAESPLAFGPRVR